MFTQLVLISDFFGPLVLLLCLVDLLWIMYARGLTASPAFRR